MTPEWMATLFRLMAESSLRICLVAAGVGAVLLVARVHSGSVRHAAWSAVLAAMLLMPVLPYWTPSITVPLPSQATRVEAVPAVLEAVWTEPPDDSSEAPSAALARSPAMTVSATSSVVKVPPRALWSFVVVAVYLAGLSFLLARLLAGWLAIRRVVRATVPVDKRAENLFHDLSSTAGSGLRGSTRSPRPEPVEGRTRDSGLLHESSAIATPLTIGIFTPRILLPAGWQSWPEEKLRAVLAHELAHVRRRDALVALVARLNLCLFWFHPVAWWLERKLATTAEHACDAAGVRVMGEKRRYAEVLLDMAEAVRHAGGRLSWDGVGVHGTGLLGQRIDRVLRGDVFREVSMTRKIIVALSCAAIVFLVVACRRQAPPAPPLKEDPQFVAQQAENRARIEFETTARDMTAAQVAEAAIALQKNPEDLTTRKKLLTFALPYGVPVPGDKDKWAPRCAQVIGNEQCIALRRAQVLWVIEHHPDSEVLGGALARIPPGGGHLNDPLGYAEARNLWLSKTAPAATAAAVLGNAANFFTYADKPLAEQMLLRAQAMDPKGPWVKELGRLYAAGVLGVPSLFGPWRAEAGQASSPFAAHARKQLEESRDPHLLAEAGWWLNNGGARAPQAADPVALATTCAERTLALDPQHVQAHVILAAQRQRESYMRMRQRLGNARGEAQQQAAAALPDAERFEFLPQLAVDAYMWADYLDSVHKAGEAEAERGRARKYAEEALRLAPAFAQSARFGTAIYAGNLVLAGLTLRAGDGQRAGRYLIEASKAPANDELRYSLPGPGFQLLGYMLKYDIRDPVVEFLERVGQMNAAQGKYLLAAADQIRKGYRPIYYPRPRPYYPGIARQ